MSGLSLLRHAHRADRSFLTCRLHCRAPAKLGLVGLWLSVLPLLAQEEVTPEETAQPATIKLNDGSRINGEVLQMTGDELKIKTLFGGEIPVKWSEIIEFSSELKLRVVLNDERVLHGTVEPGEGDTLSVRTEDGVDPILVPFTAVSAINPPEPEKKKISYKGYVNVGINILDGNSQTKAANANAELVIRSETHRGTLKGIWSFAEDSGRVSARNARGSAKYDYFMNDRLYLYTSVLLEGNSFQNLELRTVLSGGFGYQFIEEGDFTSEYFKKLEAYGELGASYFHEDLQDGTKEEFVSGRWSVKVDWEFLPGRVSFFHNHEGYPSYEDLEDILIITEQGLRFTLLDRLIASLQINWRWDNVPAKDTERGDTLYLFTLGYKFDA